jgi:hypothetical protein
MDRTHHASLNGTAYPNIPPAPAPSADASHLEDVVRLLDNANVPKLGVDGETPLTVAQRVAILAAWARARRR